MSELTDAERFAELDHDPQAMRWAKHHIQRVYDQLTRQRDTFFAHGNTAMATKYDFAARALQDKLLSPRVVGTGPFNEHMARIRRLVDQ